MDESIYVLRGKVLEKSEKKIVFVFVCTIAKLKGTLRVVVLLYTLLSQVVFKILYCQCDGISYRSMANFNLPLSN